MLILYGKFSEPNKVRKIVSLVYEHSSTNPKVPGSILGPVPFAQKDPICKEQGATPEILVSYLNNRL